MEAAINFLSFGLIGRKNFSIVSLFFVVALAGCAPACLKMEPSIICPVLTEKISALPSAFPPLSLREQKQEWAKELLCGEAFSSEWDLYRAITCFKRALILLPLEERARRLQLDYDMILCYYLGNKYEEALQIFEKSEISHATPDFPAFNNLLIIIFDCYQQTGEEEKAECVMEAIRKYSPDTATDLELYWDLNSCKLEEARYIISQHRDAKEMEEILACYDRNVKSIAKARALNAILPGAGYYYVGQHRSAFTSFVINALFIAASYECFRHGYPAAGIITASLEAGWYFGGINGAGIEANAFNTRLYEGMSHNLLKNHFCFPIFMFETSF